MRLRYEPSVDQIVKELQAQIHRGRWKEVVFCGFGESTMRLDCVLQVTKWVKENSGLRVRIDTNGHGCLLNPGRSVVEELKEAGTDDLSVSLNGQDKETYDAVCRPTFADAYESVLRFIQEAENQLDVEVTAVRIPEVDVSKVERQASQLGVKFRAREYISTFY